MKTIFFTLLLSIALVSCEKTEMEDIKSVTDTTSTSKTALTLSDVDTKIVGKYHWYYNGTADYHIQFNSDATCLFTFTSESTVVQYTYYCTIISDSTFQINIVRSSPVYVSGKTVKIASDLIFYNCSFSGNNIYTLSNTCGTGINTLTKF